MTKYPALIWSAKHPFSWIYGVCFLFLASLTLFLWREQYWVTLLPVVAGLVLLALFHIDKFVLLLVFLTPLTIHYELKEAGIGMNLPTEPFMFGIMILFLIKQLLDGGYDMRALRHPLSIIIIIHLVWMAMTCLMSTMPLVSLKFTLSRLWFVVVFYFLMIQIFRRVSNINSFLWLYLIPLSFVIIYTLYGSYLVGFNEYWTQRAMRPLFRDHTLYGAVLAMFVPVVAGFALSREQRRNVRIASFILSALFALALLYSYTRAAWVSVMAAVVVFILLWLRVKFWLIALVAGAIAVTIFSYRTEIIMMLEKNEQGSSGEFEEHVRSIANIRNDVSNLERINRWNCALRMFSEKPVSGWGPGTYMFQYAPFQRSYNRTRISTNFGDVGNAHSEYIGPLAETGLPGALLFLLIAATGLFTGIRLYMKSENPRIKWVALAVTLGLVTYFVHGMLNNFLDTDKASVPLWGFLAILVSLELYHLPRSEGME